MIAQGEKPPTAPEAAVVESALKKVTRHIIPFLLLMYVIAFV